MGRLCYGVDARKKVSAYALDCEILCGCCGGDQSSRVWRFGGASVAIGWLSRSGGAPRQNRRELFLLLPSGHSHCVIQTFCLRLTSQLIFGLPADHPVAVSVAFCRRLFPTSTCESASRRRTMLVCSVAVSQLPASYSAVLPNSIPFSALINCAQQRKGINRTL